MVLTSIPAMKLMEFTENPDPESGNSKKKRLQKLDLITKIHIIKTFSHNNQKWLEKHWKVMFLPTWKAIALMTDIKIIQKLEAMLPMLVEMRHGGMIPILIL